jgi:hypothetical protein
MAVTGIGVTDTYAPEFVQLYFHHQQSQTLLWSSRMHAVVSLLLDSQTPQTVVQTHGLACPVCVVHVWQPDYTGTMIVSHTIER